MAQHGATSGPPTEPDASLHQVVLDDLRKTRFDRDYLRELQAIYHFYLADESRARLAKMGRIRRSILLLGWTVKSLLVKLAPARRLMLIGSFLLFVSEQLAKVIFGVDKLELGYFSFV